MRKDSFERFYYEKIGLGEGCGCAEHVTRIRDLDALGERLASGRVRPGALAVAIGWLRKGVGRIFERGTQARP
ncbi:hypothetical protein RB623_27150 [Mesorhizobium sp. LHD-90]|uniref:hypothetical protein n=1 Tax=Mesorhizobium sp. LHD-90 TaxID=3071414 RepID=UPI0027DF063E|nr:hypothetical protein [Mesorhizobium sp. LHD-90]MDQ6437746.1 hypothetical protein [Mesorhizobium sp. LHD-90]